MKSALWSLPLLLSAAPAWAQRPNLPPGGTNWTPPPPTLQGGIVTSDMTQNTAAGLAALFAEPGLVLTGASFSGAQSAVGRMSGGTDAFGFDEGVLLSTGNVASIVGPLNRFVGVTTWHNTAGDPAIPGSFDGAGLSFTLQAPSSGLVSFQVIFASEEYNEYISFNDAFVCLVNGVNVALVPGTSQPIGVGSVNCGSNGAPNGGPNCGLFRNNDCNSLGFGYPCGTIPTELDGMTVLLTITAPVNAGPNTIRMAVGDIFDGAVDSVAILRAGSLRFGNPAPVFLAPSPCGQGLAVRANDPLTFNLAAEATNGFLGQSASLSLLTPSALLGATFTPPLGVSGQPATTQVVWTPGLADIGSRTVRFRATDQLGRFRDCEFQVVVEPDPPYIPCQQRLVRGGSTQFERQGEQVAYWDGRALVGSPARAANQGGVTFYEEQNNNWVQVADFTSPFPSGGQDSFGWAVAMSGNWAVVGAPFEGTPAQFNGPGAAYVYRRNAAGVWEYFQTLQRSGVTTLDDRFGLSVAIEGAYIMVGAFGDSTTAPNAGAAYVFRLAAGTWILEQKLVASVVQNSMRFGTAVSVSSGYAIVGAPYEDHSGFNEAGAAYVFERQANGVWFERGRFGGPQPGFSTFYGISVSLSGARAAVGAEGVGGVGQAYVYRRDTPTSWPLEAVLDPQVPTSSLTFGQQVAIRGNVVLVNGRNASVAGLPVAGRVEVFERVPGFPWTFTRALTKAVPSAFDSFGTGLALGSGVALVGCPGDDTAGFANSGAAYLFDLGIADCNGNGQPDSCDIAGGVAVDCNGNLIPDSCDIASGFAADCNGNGVPDACDVASGAALDCNGNGVPDSCDVLTGAVADCNQNGIPDSCEIAANSSLDCNGDGVLDVCQLGSLDCNNNQVLDPCETAANPAIDINSNSVPDECEDDVGIIYCSPNAPNSGFPGGAKMQAIGTASVNVNDIVLIARDLPTNSFGFFIASRNAGFVPFPGGSQGILCLGGTIGRFQQQVQNAGTLNRISIMLDNRNVPFPSGPGFATIAPGERWHFQAWFRDSVNGQSTSNYTEGLFIQY